MVRATDGADQGNARGGQKGGVVGGQIGHRVSGHQMGGPHRGDDGGDHGDADGAPQLALAVEQGGGVAGVGGGDGGERCGLRRHDDLGHRQSHGEHEHPHPPQVGIEPDQGHERGGGGHTDQAGCHQAAGPDPRIEEAEAIWAPTITPMASGKVLSPDCRADRPRAIWKNRGAAKSTPKKAAMAIMMTSAGGPEQPVAVEAELEQRLAGPELDGHHPRRARASADADTAEDVRRFPNPGRDPR